MNFSPYFLLSIALNLGDLKGHCKNECLDFGHGVGYDAMLSS